MKRSGVLFSIFAAFILVFVPFQGALADTKVNVILDGRAIAFDAKPMLKEGRTLIPLRVVFEELGLNVRWNQATRTATISSDTKTIVITEGSHQVTVNAIGEILDVPATIYNNRMYVPIHIIAATSDLNVKWDSGTSTVHLQTTTLPEVIEEDVIEEDVIVEEEAEEVIEEELENAVNIDEHLQKLSAIDINSFSTKYTMEQKMQADDMNIEMNIKGEMDIVLDPFGMYQHMKMKMFGEDLEMEMYMTEQGFYMYDPMENQWIKDESSMGEFENILDMVNGSNNPLAQLDLMKEYLSEVKIHDKGSYYEMEYSIKTEGYKHLVDEMLGSFLLDEEEFPMPDMTFNTMSFSISYAKDTYFPTAMSAHIDMEMNMDGEVMQIFQKMNGTYLNINGFDQINIPQDIIDSAIEMQY
jgi:hypothetical protein